MPSSSFGESDEVNVEQMLTNGGAKKIDWKLEDLGKELIAIGQRLESLMDLLVINGMFSEREYELAVRNVFKFEVEGAKVSSDMEFLAFLDKRRKTLEVLINEP